MKTNENLAQFQKMPKILVVDDEYDVAMSFKIGLENNGFVVDMFTNPKMALSSFKPGYYSLLLLDIRMPKMTGFELYNAISKIDANVKVCFTTFFTVYYKSLNDHYPDIDQTCFISKPVLIDDLVKHIRNELNRKGKASQNSL